MKLIQLSSRTNHDWSGRFVDNTSYDLLLNEDAEIRKPDGSLLLKLLKNKIPRPLIAQAWEAIGDVNLVTKNRGVATGSDTKEYRRKDGTLSNTQQAESVASGIIGYFERTARFPYCRACAWNLKQPERWSKLLPMVQEVSRMYSEAVPDRFSQQLEVVNRTSKDFVIPGTVFTTLTLNKNFRTACHLDAGDLPQGISCMSLIREGKFSGGHIVFPDFRVAAQLDTGDLIIFDPHEFHGNTKIVPLSEKYQRCTIVYYFREKMTGCASAKEEEDRVKRRSRGSSLFDG